MVGAVPEHICKRQSRYLSVTADAGKCAKKAREGLVFCFFVTVILLGARQSTIQSVQNESAAHRSSKKA